ncbi:phosphate ABC transporter permease subunit PstC [Leptothermofonsia sichuanensis E412]|uniref:phosphate ABC transporter permease subunit PstC n=1 Tax=Leptothermofonsia sichuanensis TaxID=2917832 RepID=UPI001CA764AE|nr:phosphate ABC transporter permease subunit PstC [Leptothermofonsia sichuanensis]QZZ21067.1 phosphate ABC transporter permease subunit PstC [Leptothermofonsia sichuanensis E412]
MAPIVDTSSAPSWKRTDASRWIDNGFVWLTAAFAIAVAILLIAIALQVGGQAMPAIRAFGLGFLVNSRWDPVANIYGAWPQVYGTIVTALIALVIAMPVGVGIALFLSEDFLPDKIKQPIVFLIELLAAIPSVIYGIWGIFVFIPFIRPLGNWLHQNFGWIPLFSTPPAGPGVYVAGIILAVMILPIIAAISRDALVAVPSELRQAAYGLGATRWETIFKVILPAASSGILGGAMLGLGRAMGETMAVTMVIGNSNAASPSILAQGSTVASLLANQFAEAGGLQVSSLMYAALVLFLLTLIVNIIAQYIVSRIRLKY